MAKKILLLSLIVFSFSCNSKKKYEGKWADIYYKSENWDSFDRPQEIIIENDSIKFNYPYFDYWLTYSLEIEKNQLTFNNFKVNAYREKDTLILNNRNFLINENDTLYDWFLTKKLISLKFPNINGVEYQIDEPDIISQIYIGKRLDDNGFSLQLNDKLTNDYQDLIYFLNVESSALREELAPFPLLRLFIDKDTPMHLLEEVFYNSMKVNNRKLEFINSLDLKIDDTLGIYYSYTSLKKTLPHFEEENWHYFSEKYKIETPPSLPDSFPPAFENESVSIIFLIANDLYFNQQKITFLDLKSIIEEIIENNGVLISLYDLDSNFGGFLELLAETDKIYSEKRNGFARNNFGKTYGSLKPEQKILIREKVPQKHVWSYSIPLYQSFVKDKKTLMGLKVQPIDSLLPEFFLNSETMLRQAQHDN